MRLSCLASAARSPLASPLPLLLTWVGPELHSHASVAMPPVLFNNWTHPAAASSLTHEAELKKREIQTKLEQVRHVEGHTCENHEDEPDGQLTPSYERSVSPLSS